MFHPKEFTSKRVFEQVKQWIIEHQSDVVLLIGVVLISLLSFATGYIVAKQQEKEPIRIEFRIQNLESIIV